MSPRLKNQIEAIAGVVASFPDYRGTPETSLPHITHYMLERAIRHSSEANGMISRFNNLPKATSKAC
jgi:hypothetical protein